MMSPLKAQLLALSLVIPAVAFHSVGAPRKAASLQPGESAQLVARCDPSLESMRAGRVDGPSTIGEDERAELRAMQATSCGIEHLRAGGGGGLLLILAVVILILLLL
jgi:hypothetical protein